jgi:hypothetical protein
MTDTELIADIQRVQQIMLDVCTHDLRIRDAEQDYIRLREGIRIELAHRSIADPNRFDTCRAWYEFRREMLRRGDDRSYVSDLYSATIQTIRETSAWQMFDGLTGWERADRELREIKRQLLRAQHPEQFQQIGLLCRELLVTVGLAIYCHERHGKGYSTPLTQSQSKGMLSNYVDVELSDLSKEFGSMVSEVVNAANKVVHVRTTSFREAALAAEAASAVAKMIAVIAGRRDSIHTEPN